VQKSENKKLFFFLLLLQYVNELNHQVLQFANHALTNLVGLLAMLSKNIMALVGGLSISFTWIYVFVLFNVDVEEHSFFQNLNEKFSYTSFIVRIPFLGM
jgi:hypothetical protein